MALGSSRTLHRCRRRDRANRVPQRRESGQPPDRVERCAKRPRRILGASDAIELEALRVDFLFEIRDLETGDAMAPRDELTAQRGERMDVPGNRRRDDPEVPHRSLRRENPSIRELETARRIGCSISIDRGHPTSRRCARRRLALFAAARITSVRGWGWSTAGTTNPAAAPRRFAGRQCPDCGTGCPGRSDAARDSAVLPEPRARSRTPRACRSNPRAARDGRVASHRLSYSWAPSTRSVLKKLTNVSTPNHT